MLHGLRRLSIIRPGSSEIRRSGCKAIPSVAVVVPCRNELIEVVRLTIESVLDLEYPNRKLTVIISDNSDDGHTELKHLSLYIKGLQARGKNI